MSATKIGLYPIARTTERLPLRGPIRSSLAAVPLALLLGGFILLALYINEPTAWIIFGAPVLMIVTVVVGAMVMSRQLTATVVRISRRAGALRFVGAPTAPIIFFAAALIASVTGLFLVLSDVDVAGRLSGVVAGAGLLWLVQQLWALRLPSGLTLSETGLRGVRGSKAVRLLWDDLDHAEATSYKTSARLRLYPHVGRSVEIDPHYLASDPNVVAAVINFFVEHPEHRAALAAPVAALDLVTDWAKTKAD